MTAGWRDRAACIGHDQNLWYPVRGGSNAKALAICEACPVKVECGEYGGCTTGGVGAVMTDDERRERTAERAEAGLVSDPVLVALFGARP